MDNDIKNALNCKVDSNLNLVNYNLQDTNSNQSSEFLDTTAKALNNLTIGDNYNAQVTSCWHWWEEQYYPRVIRESYPVYIQERSLDKGKQAYEIIKMLRDKRFINVDKTTDFIEIMDSLIKML